MSKEDTTPSETSPELPQTKLRLKFSQIKKSSSMKRDLFAIACAVTLHIFLSSSTLLYCIGDTPKYWTCVSIYLIFEISRYISGSAVGALFNRSQ